MMSATFNFFNTFLIYFLLLNSFSQSIHILKPTPNDYYTNLKHKTNNVLISPIQSPLSKLCNKVLDTYQYMGSASLEPFRDCNEDLIDFSDKRSYPYCYSSIDNFYCYYYFSNNQSKDCPSNEVIDKILNVIKMCVVTKRNSQTEFICRSLDIITNKIVSSEEFCNNAERIVYNSNKEREYIPMKNQDKPSCKKISELYNTCIDMKTLFPNSSEKDCFNVNHISSYCNSIREYDNTEKKLCSKYVLPKFAHSALYDKINFMKNNICDNIEQNLVNDYANNEKKIKMKIIKKENELKELNNTNSNNKELIMMTNITLTKMNNITKEWISFYAELTSTFIIRKTLTSNEDSKLKELKKLFELYSSLSSELYRMTRDHTIDLSHFDNLYQTLKTYIQKVILYNKELEKKINVLSYIIKSNQNITLNREEENDEEDGEKITITEKEINEYQNEYIKILNYIKRFVDFVNNNAVINQNSLETKNNNIKKEIEELQKHLKINNMQRTNYVKETF